MLKWTRILTRIQPVSLRRFRNRSRPKLFLEMQIHRHVLYFQCHVHPLITPCHPRLKRPSRAVRPVCTPPFPVVSSQAPTLPAFFSHDHQSTSASASFFQSVPSRASALPVSSSRVTDRPPTFTSSSTFPVGSLRVFAWPFSRVPDNPGFARTASCDPAPLLHIPMLTPLHSWSSIHPRQISFGFRWLS